MLTLKGSGWDHVSGRRSGNRDGTKGRDQQVTGVFAKHDLRLQLLQNAWRPYCELCTIPLPESFGTERSRSATTAVVFASLYRRAVRSADTFIGADNVGEIEFDVAVLKVSPHDLWACPATIFGRFSPK